MKLRHRRVFGGRLFESVVHFYNGDPKAKQLANAIREMDCRARVVKDRTGFDHVFVGVAHLPSSEIEKLVGDYS